MKAARLSLPILLTGLCHLHAATLYWDTNGDTVGAGTAGVSTGTWDGTASNWTSDSTGASVTGSYVAGSDVMFAAGSDTTSATITVTGTQSVNSASFEEGSYTFSGGTVSLGDGSLTINSSASVQQGSTTIQIAGAQVWTNNGGTFTTNSAGFSVAASIATPSLTLKGPGSFSIRAGLADSSGGGAFSLTIADGASVTQNNTLANTYTGGLFIKSGSLRVTLGATNLGGSSNLITLGDTSGSADATLTVVNNSVIANAVNVLSQGNSTIAVGGAGNTTRYTGKVTLNNTAPLKLTTTAASGSTPAIIFDTTSTISGTGGIAMTRNGSNLNALNVTLRGNNTYSGGTTVNYGSLRIDNGGSSSSNSAIGTGTLTINGGSIDNTSAGAVTLATNNVIVLNANLSFTGTNSLNLGTGTVSLGTASGTTRIITTSGATLTIGGVISDGTTAKGIVKAGTGTLVLSGNNTYTTTTAVNAGRLFVNGTHSGTGDVTVATTATLGGSGALSGNTTANSGAFLSPGADSTAGTLTFSGTLNISGLSGGTGGLLFDLAAAGASDRINSGSLNIGTGLLDLNDFTFTTLGGYTDGVYTLFSATSIVGTLGSSLTGTVGGISSILSISGNDIILTVGTIPEPSTYALLAGSAGLMVVGLRRYRNHRSL